MVYKNEKCVKDLAHRLTDSIDNIIHVPTFLGGKEIKSGNQNVSLSIEKIEESVEHILDQNESIESELEDLKSDMTFLKTQISTLTVSNFSISFKKDFIAA